MIEQAMYFAIGFCAAALLALAVLPAFWDRALRLTRRRLEAQMAMSPEQITAARDQLRAEFAVQQRRLELQLEAVLAHRHADLSEIGRRTATSHALENASTASRNEIARLQQANASQQAETEALKAELSALEAAHAALQSAHQELGERRDNLAAELRSITDVATERHAELLSVETLISGLRARARDLETMLATSRNEVSARNKALRELETTHRTLSNEASGTAARLQEAEEHIRELNAELAGQTSARDELAAKHSASETNLRNMIATEAEISRALNAEGQRIQSLEKQLAKQSENAKLMERDLTEMIDRLRTEKNLAEGALEKSRLERGKLQTELRALRPANDIAGAATQREESQAQLTVQAGE